MGNLKNVAIWIVIGLLMVALYWQFVGAIKGMSKACLKFKTPVTGGNVSEVIISGNLIEGRFNDGTEFQSYAPEDPSLIDKLNSQGVTISAEPISESALFSIFISWFPMLLLIGVWVFFLRQMQSGGKGAMGFGKSKAKLLNEQKGKITLMKWLVLTKLRMNLKK